MIIAYRLTWCSELEDCLLSLKKNIQEMNMFGAIQFIGDIYVLDNKELEPEKIIVIRMESPIDVFFPRFLKKIAFRLSLKKYKYNYSINYIKDQNMLTILMDDEYSVEII